MTAEQIEKIRWLNRAFHARNEARAWDKKYQEDQSIAERIRCGLASSGGGGSSGNATEAALIRLSDTGAERDAFYLELQRIRDEITQAIQQLNDPDERAILVRHFLGYESFDKIAEKMHYGRTTVMRKYKRAIDKLVLNGTEKY